MSPKPHGSLEAEVLRTIGFLGSWRADYQSGTFWADASVGAVLGLSAREAAAGINLGNLDRCLHPADWAAMDEKRQRFRQSGPGHHSRFDYRVMHPSGGGCIRVETSQLMMVDRDGVRKHAVGTLTDVTALLGPDAASPAWRAVSEACGMVDEAAASSTAKLPCLDKLAADLVAVCRDARSIGLPALEADLKPALARVSRLLSSALRRSIHH